MGTPELSLAAAFDELPANFQSHKCTILRISRQLSEDDRGTLQAMLDDESITSVRITQALRMIGHPVSPTTVSRHRRGVCRCER